jgi:hypothetical protein
MDPLIEVHEWDDFLATFNVLMSEFLMNSMPEKYVARIERRVYTEHHCEDGYRPGGEPMRESYVCIRECPSLENVTIIQTLSPSNKRPGSDGRREYLTKRQSILESPVHLVELDLLRRGARLPMSTPLPSGDYFAIVSRAPRRPRAQVYSWHLLHPLPTISIPLRKPDPDVPLELQGVFADVFARARYHLTLDYDHEASCCLSEVEQAWLKERLAARATSAHG